MFMDTPMIQLSRRLLSDAHSVAVAVQAAVMRMEAEKGMLANLAQQVSPSGDLPELVLHCVMLLPLNASSCRLVLPGRGVLVAA